MRYLFSLLLRYVRQVEQVREELLSLLEVPCQSPDVLPLFVAQLPLVNEIVDQVPQGDSSPGDLDLIGDRLPTQKNSERILAMTFSRSSRVRISSGLCLCFSWPT